MPSALSVRLRVLPARVRRVLPARLRRALPRMTRRRAVAAALALALVAGLIGWAAWPARPAWTASDQRIVVRSGPTGAEPVDLDTRFYLPTGRSGRVPAVLLAHGFGGSKDSVRTDAEDLAARGYAVLTYTARGFGRSGGEIHLDSPDYEVRDAQRLLDWLAARPEVRTDAPGDPRVGVVGGSYGGALALLLAGVDRRVDAIVPAITWNDLARSFLPQSTTAPEPAAAPVAPAPAGPAPAGPAPAGPAPAGAAPSGVFKKGWAGLFFGGGISPGSAVGGAAAGNNADSGGNADSGSGGADGSGGVVAGAASGPDQPGAGGPDAVDPSCGRFAADVCAAYLAMATAGNPTPAALALLRRSSPATVLSAIKAPTLLVQGEVDTLFPLAEADANARGIAAAGTPVRVAWFTGGHDGGPGPESDQNRVKFLTLQWLDHYVKGAGKAPATSFTYSRVAGFSALDRGLVTNGYAVDTYPGLAGTGRDEVTVAGPAQRIANPPDGNPAAISALPGLGGGLGSLLNGIAGDLPGQHAEFVSAPLPRPLELVGAPTTQLRAASPSGEAVLFVKLYDVDPQGTAALTAGLVAPVRLTGLGTDVATAKPVTVTLPAIVRRIDAGHRLRLVVATSDQGYTSPVLPTVYTVAAGPTGAATGVGGAVVALPTMTGDPIASPAVIWRYVLAALLAVIALGLAVTLLALRRRHRRAEVAVVEEHAQTPLVVRGLRKAYADGFVAVELVDFTVERGQVVGLLGPNGAGKTTTLRVLLGLTLPTAGEVLVFGHRLAPGSPVLSRLGALVEGPGFLPHLSGRENLKAYWRATGRPAEHARFDEALEIAGLGDSIHRKTKNYSHGMKQRLAIAQAMLGLPELLVLDEPTDGLDPPQIAEMRRVLRRYATDGRAVLVSSHLLAEVEQTCTHVVVVHKGRIVASGEVEEIVGDSPSVQLDVSDVPAAEAVLDRLGVRSVTDDGAGGLVVDMNGTARSEVVAELVRAGVGVEKVVPRRRLEDAFLALVGDNSRGSGDR